MKDLSIIQEYFICIVNEKGKISGFSIEKPVCFVAAGLLELQIEKCVSIDKKMVTVTRELPEEKNYLKPLYDFVNQSKPVKLEKLLEAYHYSITDKKWNELMESVGSSLQTMGLVEAGKTGLLGNKKSFVPAKNAVNGIVEKVRAEVLEDGELTEDVAALVILLEKSKSLKTYFSEFEQKEIKTRLKEIADTPNGKMIKYMVEYVENMIVVMTAVIATLN